jgi:hypothetical protein
VHGKQLHERLTDAGESPVQKPKLGPLQKVQLVVRRKDQVTLVVHPDVFAQKAIGDVVAVQLKVKTIKFDSFASE